MNEEVKFPEEVKAIIDTIKDLEFLITNDEIDGVMIEGWTDGGVDMIECLDIQDKDIKDPAAWKEAIISMAENFDIDEEIDMYRENDKKYCNDFSIRESVKDFEAWQERLTQLAEVINLGYIVEVKLDIRDGLLYGVENYADRNYVKNITIPSTVKEIDKNAFWNCRNLEEVTIPSTVKNFDKNAFCSGVKITHVEDKEVVKAPLSERVVQAIKESAEQRLIPINEELGFPEEVKAIIYNIEDLGFSITPYEEGGVVCGADIEGYTNSGVDKLDFLNLRDKDIKDPAAWKEAIISMAEAFDIDDEIIMYRENDKKYCNDFSCRESVKDFEAWQESLNQLVESTSTVVEEMKNNLPVKDKVAVKTSLSEKVAQAVKESAEHNAKLPAKDKAGKDKEER